MGSNGNGYKAAIAVVVFIVTLLGSGVGIYNTFHVPLREAIAKEAEARQSDDKEIRKEIQATCKEFNSDVKEITATLSDIRAQMARIEAKVEKIP